MASKSSFSKVQKRFVDHEWIKDSDLGPDLDCGDYIKSLLRKAHCGLMSKPVPALLISTIFIFVRRGSH